MRTAPARLVAGIAARRKAGAGPLALVPCDNTPGNGALAERVVGDLAELIDDGLASVARGTRWPSSRPWSTGSRPARRPDDVRTVLEATGFDDRCPVVTEPFHEWVLSGAFPAGRPRWEDAGATFTDDITPYEHRKLWLLNGAHSLLAYAGSIRGHADRGRGGGRRRRAGPGCEEWWAVASPHLDQPAADVAAYATALLERFGNARMHDRLDRIAADGSQKLPIRILPVLRAERAAGRVPAGATRVLAAWICHLRGLGAPVSDVRADEVVPLAKGPLATAVPRVLGWLDQALGADADVVAMVVDQSKQLVELGRSEAGASDPLGR